MEIPIDLVLLLSGWIAFLGLAIYMLSSGRITWKQFMGFLDALADDPHILKRLWAVYTHDMREKMPTVLQKLVDEWFESKGSKFRRKIADQSKAKKKSKKESGKPKKKEKKEEEKAEETRKECEDIVDDILEEVADLKK